VKAGVFRFDITSIRGRTDASYGPARPAAVRLAAAAPALKDASCRASARWPRKNEAILDLGGARCLELFRPGRENGTPAEPENAGWERLGDHDGRASSDRPGGSRLMLAMTRGPEAESGGVLNFRVSGVGFSPVLAARGNTALSRSA